MYNVGTDIDMKNCHPVLLRYICNLHGIKCPELEYYVNHRDECLAEFPVKQSVKTHIWLLQIVIKYNGVHFHFHRVLKSTIKK